MADLLPPAVGDDRAVVLDALVAQALDDLEEGHLDIEGALRVVALAAWWAGRACPTEEP